MDDTQPRAHSRRIDDIEALRGLSIILVLIIHAPNVLAQPYGFTSWLLTQGWTAYGVNIFFVISGFVIARGLFDDLRRGRTRPAIRASLRAFWIRRAFRIFPAAWLWLAIVLVEAATFGRPDLWGSLRTNIWGALAGVFCFADVRLHDAFYRWDYGATSQYWSLSLEEKFYLVLPLVILLTSRLHRFVLPCLLFGLIALQYPLAHGIWYPTLRTDSLLWGVLLALFTGTALHRRVTPAFLGRHWGFRVGFVALCLLGLSLAARFATHFPPLSIGTVAILATLLVWPATYDRDFICAGPRLKRFMLWVGSRSFAIYLAHPSMFLIASIAGAWLAARAPRLAPHQALVNMLIAAPLLAAAAELTFRGVERPMRRVGMRLAAPHAGHTPAQGSSTILPPSPPASMRA